jgi:hypothetical protein
MYDVNKYNPPRINIANNSINVDVPSCINVLKNTDHEKENRRNVIAEYNRSTQNTTMTGMKTKKTKYIYTDFQKYVHRLSGKKSL